MWRGLVLLLAGLLLILPAAPVPAQTTGDIEGKITDVSGAELPGVGVEARSPSLQGVRTATTDAEGRYRFPGVPPGVYTIRVTVNPPYAADRKGNCPRVKDPATGLCHQFAERSYANNVGEAQVIIPDHPGRQGYGTIKNAPTITAADEIDHKGQ